MSSQHFSEKPIDLAGIAEAFDLVGIKVEKPEAVGPALDRAFSVDRTAVVDVHIEETLRARELQEEWWPGCDRRGEGRPRSSW